MNIASLLAAVTDPDRPAIIMPGAGMPPVSFRALDDLSSRMAEGFWRHGVRENDRVVVLTLISVNLYASLIALFKLGATAVFLDPQTGYSQLERTAALIDASAIICTGKVSWLRNIIPSLRRIPRVFVTDAHGRKSLARLAGSFEPRGTVPDSADDDAALITFTGGTTDSAGPRGVIRSHGLLNAQHLALSRALPTQAGDVDMPAFPVVTLHNLASGITSVLPDFPFRRPDAVRPQNILEQIAAHGVTTASGPPAYWAAIARYCLTHGETLPLRRIVTGGAVASRALLGHLQRAAPSAEILIVYGSTEAEPVSVIQGYAFLAQHGLSAGNANGVPLGPPVAEVAVRILDTAGQDMAPGEVGEIWVAGAHVARRYFANTGAQALNKRTGPGGQTWHRMGDIGFMDSAGCVWLSGRVNTTVMRAGCPLYPVPIEALAATLPYIYRAALFGVRDPALGQRAVLAVEFLSGAPRPRNWRLELKGLCAAHGWVLDNIFALRHLPVDARHNSRVDYARLQGMLRRA